MDESDRYQLRLHEMEMRAFLKKAAPVRAAIRNFISERAGEDLAAKVQIGFSPDMKEVGFNIWYRWAKTPPTMHMSAPARATFGSL